jgi:hypothetical protein
MKDFRIRISVDTDVVQVIESIRTVSAGDLRCLAVIQDLISAAPLAGIICTTLRVPITLLPREMADSDATFSGLLKISNKVKKISATMRIHSMWNLYP